MVRTPVCDKDGLKKGTWTPEEDKKLVDYITRYGHWNWRLLPKFAGLARCGKSCRLRWLNYLRPNLKRGNYTQEEEETIIKLHQHLGNRWSAIAAQMPGRTDNEIKNHWHSNLKKRSQNNLVATTQISNSKEQSPSESSASPHPTQDSCSFPSSMENLALHDEFSFLNADMALMSENLWLEPHMFDISYIPSEPEHCSPFVYADLWSHDY